MGLEYDYRYITNSQNKLDFCNQVFMNKNGGDDISCTSFLCMQKHLLKLITTMFTC